MGNRCSRSSTSEITTRQLETMVRLSEQWLTQLRSDRLVSTKLVCHQRSNVIESVSNIRNTHIQKSICLNPFCTVSSFTIKKANCVKSFNCRSRKGRRNSNLASIWDGLIVKYNRKRIWPYSWNVFSLAMVTMEYISDGNKKKYFCSIDVPKAPYCEQKQKTVSNAPKKTANA